MLRLEPDKYHFDTEQGWWDDEHLRKFGHLVPPYETIASWCAAHECGGGFAYTYMQLGMPSDDFARAHPQWMLFNDASEVDKRTPGMKPSTSTRTTSPTSPMTTPTRSSRNTSSRCGRKSASDGVRGVKVDYPATAWRPEGGFDDRHATTNSAYRRAFELLREAMGKDGFIDERNLGESATALPRRDRRHRGHPADLGRFERLRTGDDFDQRPALV